MGADFFQQCGPLEIYWDAIAVAPVTILGAIPGGQVFEFEGTGGGTSIGMSILIVDPTS